ncbi:MAG: adenosylcobinamide-phosphate synthase CbiB [Oscillospiraceae bacterium]|nr:adenosylcobinamide-phosphate synthase CbiB [Oscillospiraceae bacterium]
MLTLAALGGFVLDLLLGDPAWMPHPVVYMGRAITWLERHLRRRLPDTPSGQRAGGLILAVGLPLGTLVRSGGLSWLAWRVHPLLGFALQVLWAWQCLAMCCLSRESRRVWHSLTQEGLEQARQAVGRIVGRDTGELTAQGVTRAAVETVAENFSDGEMAPLFWFLVGGAPLALCYKAVNTMDSMVGYRNDRYLYFGRCAARLDDGANWLPARLSALLLICAAWFTGADGKGAWRVWRRDRRNHASPNSAQTEAAMAGALGVQLAGPASYFGVRHEKPTIGDPVREIEPEDILRANRLMYAAGLLGLLALCALRVLIVGFFLRRNLL